MQDIINQFIDSMRKAGCSPTNSNDVIPDGKDHYTRLEGDKRDKRLGYCLTIESDGFAHGNFINFKTSDKGKWNSKKSDKGLSDEERAEIHKRVKEAEDRKEAEREAEHETAAIEAAHIWNDADPVLDHDYLTRKGIEAHGVRVSGDSLVISGSNSGKIWTIQYIEPDGGKKYLYGARKQGSYYKIAGNDDAVCIVEGFATGASVNEATKYTVYVAFDAGNLLSVGQEVKKLHPESKIIFCADNDHETMINGKLHNTGIKQANQAATKIGGATVIHPEFKPEDAAENSDFNDMHKLYGLDAVKDRILSVVTDRGGSDKLPSVQTVSVAAPTNSTKTFENLSPIYDDEKLNAALIWERQPTKTREGKVESKLLENCLVFLRHKEKYRGLFRYDRFSGNIILHREPFYHGREQFSPRQINESDIGYIRSALERDGLRAPKTNVQEAVYMVACENWIDPPLEYLESLEWDGIDRVSGWMGKYLGAVGDTEYLNVVGRSMLISIVARNYEPGCKCDTMVVLEGKQGLKKSTALKVLATVGRGKDGISYFSDALTFGKIQEKDTVLITEGKLILEIPEMGGLAKKEINEVKAWLSTSTDRLRRPYGHYVEEIPRRFIAAGTTNENQYLKDPTGNRRLFPVTCTKIDLIGLEDDKEQMFAQAVHLYKNGSKWWIDAEDPMLLKIEHEQSLRLEEDVWKYPIEMFLSSKNTTTVNDILEHFKIDIAKRDNIQKNRVISILKIIGFKMGTKWDIDTRKNISCWKRDEKVEEIIEAQFEEIAF